MLLVKKLKKMFPKKVEMHDMSKRTSEYYKVNRTLTKRYLNSAIPQMQRILNVDKKKKIEILRKLSSYPVNNGSFKSVSITEIINAYIIIIIIIIIVISIMLTVLLHLFYQILHTHPRIGVSGPVSLDHPTWSF